MFGSIINNIISINDTMILASSWDGFIIKMDVD